MPSLIEKGLNKLNKPIKKRDHNSSVFLRSFTTCLTKGNVRNLCKCLTRRLKDDLERVQPFLRTLNTFLVLSSRIVANWHQYHSYCIVLFLFFLFFGGGYARQLPIIIRVIIDFFPFTPFVCCKEERVLIFTLSYPTAVTLFYAHFTFH